MAGSASGANVVGGSSEEISIGQHFRSADSLAEWRSCEQLETSTSPPYWDTDDDDGPKPSELYGKFTWKIENFSQINKRELRSNAFEVGGYKWYILIYPQGCDVCNHLSLFLCVANHDKLLPGWGHFAQFTIAVVNKDPKKSKYSDTLHRFWKKEHDWGWKRFMELSKVYDGFIISDTLVIKAQVQVIREKAHRPLRCLDCQYRRELVRVYQSSVELICRRCVEEKRDLLTKLIEDKVRWSSFRAFWYGIDQNARCRMSRDKMDTILKKVVKNFFIEKEVTSTLVMDSLYSGLKVLEHRSENKKGRAKLVKLEKTPAPIVCIEKDMFVLADDVLLLLERATMEPLPPKDDKGPQNRAKDTMLDFARILQDGSSGEVCNKDSIVCDEMRLTELGRRTLEIFVLAHIFSNIIEVAYQEAVAFKRQEELIREEEAAVLAELELKAKHGAGEKEKRSKKKQEEKVTSLQRKPSFKDQADVNRPLKQRPAEKIPSPCSPLRSLPSSLQPKQAVEATGASEPVPVRESSSNCSTQTEAVPSISKPDVQIFVASTKACKDPVEKSATLASAVSRPFSVPISAPVPNAHVPSMVQTTPLLAQSASAAGQLGVDLSKTTSGYVSQTQSYKNAVMGSTTCATSSSSTHLHSSSSPSPSPANSQHPISPERRNLCSAITDLSFGTVVPELLPNQPQLIGDCILQDGNDMRFYPTMLNDLQSCCPCYSGGDRSQANHADEVPAASSAHQVQGTSADEFPHLDIINYLLDEDYSIGNLGMMGPTVQTLNNGNHPLNRQLTFPGDVGWVDVGPSIDYCTLNGVAKYSDDKMQMKYNYSSSLYDGMMDGALHVGLSGYMNEQIDGMIQNQWPAADLSMLGVRNRQGDGYSVQLPNYSEMACGINGYTVFRHASGH